MDTPLTLAQALCLLSVRRYKGRFLASRFRFITATAHLTELYLAGHASITGRLIKRIELASEPETPSELLARICELLKKTKKDTSLRAAIHILSRDKVSFRGPIEDLVDAGHLSVTPVKVLWIFRTNRYAETDPVLGDTILDNVSDEITRLDGPTDPRLGALIMLLREAHLLNGLLPKDILKQGRKRARQIALAKHYDNEEVRKSLAGLRGAMTIVASNAAADGGGDGGE